MSEIIAGLVAAIIIVGLMVVHEAGRLDAVTQIELAKIQAGCKP